MRRVMFVLAVSAACTLAAATPNRTATEAYVTNALAPYAKKTELPSVPTKVGALENDVGFVTKKQVTPSTKNEGHAMLADKAIDADYAAVADSAVSAQRTFWSGIDNKPTTLAGYGITDAATAKQVKSLETAINSEAGTREEGYNEIKYNMGLLDAKVAASLAAKQDRPAATATATSLSYRADGGAVSVSVADGGTLSATLDGWTDGQAQTALISLASGASVDGGVSLVGYGSWPTARFLASCVRVGSRVYVTPITYVAEED